MRSLIEPIVFAIGSICFNSPNKFTWIQIMTALSRSIISTFALVLLATTAQAASTDVPSAKFSRQQLLKKRVSLPSKEVETHVIRAQFPKGYKTPIHTHEGPGPRYVVKGKLKVEDAGESNIYGPGEVFWETGGEMTVENVAPAESEIIIFEMAPAK
jgi:quercetin dioxygenase-like cupin family protein